MTQHARTSRAFTITELLVAIAVTLVLLLGVSRIFSMTRETISTGEAVAEVNQRARALERVLRDDFGRITRGGPLVIRNERLGVRLPDDPHRELDRARRRSPNFALRNEPRFVYLNEEMEQLDRAKGDREKDQHLGVRRLDQIVFFIEGAFTSYQYREGGAIRGISRNDTAAAARIWYGHGLRDRDLFDPERPGEIKKGAGVGLPVYDSLFADPDSSDPDLANKYAQTWLLARHQALLLPIDSVQNPWQLQFAPSAIEYFNENQLPWSRTGPSGGPNTPGDPTQRLSPGLVDLIDQSLADVEKEITEYGYRYNESTGRMEQVADPRPLDRTTWQQDMQRVQRVEPWVTLAQDRVRIGDEVAETWAMGELNGWRTGQQIRMMLMTGRVRVESAPPSSRRIDQMLTQATLAQACSSFEVAWSTGEVTYPDGRVAWYDIENPANPYMPAYDFREERAQRPEQRRAQAPNDPRTWYLSESPSRDRPIPTGEVEADDLYYATFGYFIPKENDADRDEPWPWPSLIRVRVTLHDTNGRLPQGRDFEFIFKLPETIGSI